MARQKKGMISKALRFEVFKRDSFKCQYCGKCAPDVILHADHIHPESKGGTTDIINLITACEACNLGKAATPLSDSTAAAKARTQLEALQERREQLDMMMQWQHGLIGIESEEVHALNRVWGQICGRKLNESGQSNLKKHIAKFGVNEVIEAMKIAEKYLERVDGLATLESCDLAWSKVSGICAIRRSEAENPELAKAFYIRAILNRRFNMNNWEKARVLALLKMAIPKCDMDAVSDEAKVCRTLCNFESSLENFLGV